MTPRKKGPPTLQVEAGKKGAKLPTSSCFDVEVATPPSCSTLSSSSPSPLLIAAPSSENPRHISFDPQALFFCLH
eukprot:632460-Hanusia_phi.AAC.3